MGLTRKEILQAVGLILISLQFLFVTDVSAQQESRTRYRNQENLRQFSKVKAARWELDKKRADSLAKAQNLPIRYLEKNKRNVELQRLGYHNRPVYYATDNVDAARIISTDQVWTGEGGLPFLTGEGVEISLWDGGAVLSSHREFAEGEDSRVFMRESVLLESNHSTHLAGTMIASGIDEDARGMASMATVYGWNYSNDISEMAVVAAEGGVVSNHSYGPLCGWYYNSTNESWYWYGDPELSDVEDYKFGFYDEVSADMDFIAWSAPNYLMVKSAGNDRNDVPGDQPVEHLVWDESWVMVSTEREQDGGEDGYDCLTPMAVPKNILTVGAVDDNRNLSSFSAFGPTDDGRIKPDVLTNGEDVYSSIASSDHSYDSMNGTSMSAASATGSISLLHQLQQELQPGEILLSSTVKGLLIHTADECGPGAGPDYQHGWGILNIKEAADLMQYNYKNGGRNIYEGTISEGETVTIPLEITTPSSGIKITICWTDPPGEVSEPALNPSDSKLINDLNLELLLEGVQPAILPWLLDPAYPELAATQGVNHVDNVEQVHLANPSPGAYQVKISHSASLFEGSQSYSLIVTGIDAPVDLFPPRILQYNTGPLSVSLKWRSPEQSIPAFYRIYRDEVLLAETVDTIYTDLEVITDDVYEYYITAVYSREGDEHESLGTNTITATPRKLLSLPLIIDFEEDHSDVLIKNSPLGWQWGDSESLSSYYLGFEENGTHFIAADSYTYGKIAHLYDVAATLPLKLGGFKNVVLSFDYMLVSEIYGAIDEMHIMYKLQEEAEWHELTQLPRAHSWAHYSITFPDELCNDGMQIGFYYDDFYLWGMGAGLDNISIVGESGRSVDLAITSMISPVSACTLSDAEPVSIAILNAGLEDVLPGDNVVLQLNVSPDIQMEEQVVLTETLHSGENLIYQMGTAVDLSETGSYSFSFQLSSDLDNNVLNNSLTSVVEVTGNPLPTILNQDLLFCEEDDPVLIQCIPEGGILTGTGVTGLFFDPGAAGEGLHTLTYTYTDPAGCQGSANVEVEVVAQPKPVIMNKDLQFCEDDAPVLIQVSPAGGTLSGPGVSGLYFNPASAGVGTHVITYSYSDPTGCTGTVSAEVVVSPEPQVVIITELRRFCKKDQPLLLEVSPKGGTFTGPGITDLIFNPEIAGSGIHSCKYTYTDTIGCTGSDVMSLQVFENPWIDLGSDRQVGLDDTIELEPLGNGTSFLWYDGTTEKLLPIITNELGIGEYDIWVEASNPENCKELDSMLLTINTSIGTTPFSNPPEQFIYPNPFETGFYLKGCEDEHVENIILLGSSGQVYMNDIPSTFPYINAQDLPCGFYILKVQTRTRNLTFEIIKMQ